MTKYDIENNIRERFIICYSCRKMIYLKDNGINYIFKCFNEKARTPFWVFDKTQEITKALAKYKKPDEENN